MTNAAAQIGFANHSSDTLSFPMNALARTLSLVAALCALLSGCAQTGPPLPPSLELPKAPSDLRANRKGNQVTLTWSEPVRTTDRQSVRSLGKTRICRSAAAEMTECGNPAGEVAAPSRVPQKSESGRPTSQTYIDTVPPSLLEQNPTAEVTYAVEVLNRDGRGAGPSNRVHVSAVPTLPPPSDVAAELTGDGVVLTWTSASENPSTPGIQHRYRIYRREEGSSKDAIAGEVALGEAGPVRFLDPAFEWEKTYLYRITAVSIVSRTGGEARVEGDDSSVVRVFAHDTFPPAVPAGLQAVYAGEGQKPFIDLIWAPVTNSDLAGYNVYRHEANSAPVRLNTGLVQSPSYRDRVVASGKTYFYAVSAVDLRSNESAQSEEASEAVP